MNAGIRPLKLGIPCHLWLHTDTVTSQEKVNFFVAIPMNIFDGAMVGLGVANLEGQGPLYAVGGHDGWSYLNSVERWDPATRQWSFVAPMNSQRSTVGVAALNGK